MSLDPIVDGGMAGWGYVPMTFFQVILGIIVALSPFIIAWTVVKIWP